MGKVLDHPVTDLSWFSRAACRGSGVDMVPTDAAGTGRAKTVCRGCPVRLDCLEYALAFNEDKGVWGGHSERERRRILRERRRRSA